MNTPSHWLMTIVIGRLGPWRNKIPRWSLGIGSLAPDLPLYFLSLGGIFYFSYLKRWPSEKTFPHMYADDGLFFNDLGWIALHNVFHSPLSLLILFAATWLAQNKWPNATRWIRFFLAACALHSIVDILTHHDDGPLLFFPFDWQTRYFSPVSYWDSDHRGGTFMVFEAVLDLVLTGILVYPALFRSRKLKTSKNGS